MNTRLARLSVAAFAVVMLLSVASAASAQAAPVCGVPGTPACTPTPRPTRQPTEVPPVEQPAQPTVEPTAQPTATEAPLRPMPTSGPCVAAPNGNFRVNVRNWPDETIGEIVGVLVPSDVVPVLAHIIVDGAQGGWLVIDAGFVSAAAMRFGGECADLPDVDVPAGSGPHAIDYDVDGDGEVDQQIVLVAPGGGETDDDVCIIYNYHNPHGGSGEICLPFDISGSAVVCLQTSGGDHCIIVEETTAEFEQEFDLTSATPGPDDTIGDFAASSVFVVYWTSSGRPLSVQHGGTGAGDICIEYTVWHPWGKTGTMCIAADLNPGDVVCTESNCVQVID